MPSRSSPIGVLVADAVLRPSRLVAGVFVLALLLLLSAGPARATFPGPNGRIAFADYLSGQIYAVNPDGSALRQLTHTGRKGFAGNPSWSANGKRLLFERSRNVNTRIWVMRANGSHKHKVAGDAKGFQDFTPAYTPNGRRIVFTRCHPEPKDVCAIWKMRANGRHKRALTPFVHSTKDEHNDFNPSVSPNGRWIAFGRFNAGGFAARVFIMRANGAHAHAVTAAPLEGFEPDWAPSGRRITFTSQAPRPGSSIFTVRPDGSHLHQVTPSRFPHSDALSTYSPRGNRLAFISDRKHPDACCNDLFTVKPSGGSGHLIHTGLTDAGIIQPSWGRAPLKH